MDIKGYRRAHAPTSLLHRWHVRTLRRGRHIVRVHAKQKKQKQQYGPGAGGAAKLDPELEAAYQQFGRALGEAPRETASIVQRKLGIEQDTQRPSSSQARTAQRQRPQQRQIDDASYKKLERLFDMAMSDPLNDQDAQPQALIRAKARMAPSITEAQRRETLLELLENTLKPRKAAASMGMDLIEPVRPSGGQQVPKLVMPSGKTAAAVRPSSSPEASASAVPALVMPRGKQAAPVRPQSPGVGSGELVAEPARPKANLGPPPPLIQPKGRLEVQQATRLSNELDAMQRGTVSVRAPVVEEPKPKPAPQPVPQLSRAPARPAPPVTEAAQLPKAAAPSDNAPGRKPSDRIASRSTKPAAPRSASDSVLPLEIRKAPARPAGQAAETSQAASSAAQVEQTSAVLSDSAIESKPLPQLRQAPLRPRPQAADSETAAAESPDPVEQSAAQVADPATSESALPQTSPKESVQDLESAPDAQDTDAISQAAVAAERDPAQPDQEASASAAPIVAPIPLPTPQRPTRPKPPVMPTEAGPSSATSQGTEASSSATSSTSALERSAAPAVEDQEALPEALPEAAEQLEPAQADSALAAASETAEASTEAPVKLKTATRPQEDGSGLEMQLPAPPMALPKPALPAAQPDQMGKASTPGGLNPWLEGQLQVAQLAMASLDKLPGKAIAASYGGVMVQADAGIRGFLPFAQMLPERQELIRQSFDVQGLPEDLEVPQLRAAFANTMQAVVVSQRVQVYVISCKVIERPDPTQQGKSKPTIRNVFSEVTPEVDTPHVGPTTPPSAAAAKVLQSYLGQVISGVAAYVTDRYVILHFEVELDNGRLERVPGLLHSDAADIADVVEGQVIEAVLESVTTDARGLRLTGKGVRPPRQREDLQQTIEDVVSSQSTAKERMGTLPAVELLCQALTEQEGILETTPGRRLQGTAFAPEIQVFLSKTDPDAEAETDDTDENGTAKRYILLARSGNEVQEVEVLASLSREAMKSALSAALSGVIQYAS